MPIYGYRCSQCQHELEVMQRMSDAPLTECPNCGGRLEKLLYPVGVQFKGSGFYTTDYKNGSNGAKKAASSASSNGDSSSSSSSEKKSESKAETSTTTAGSGSGDSSKKSD